MYVPRGGAPALGRLTGTPVAPWSSYRKSVQNSAPVAKRLVPQVRGNSSPNGHPAGTGSSGSGFSAAGGTPSGSPLTATNSEGGVADVGVTACKTVLARWSPKR